MPRPCLPSGRDSSPCGTQDGLPGVPGGSSTCWAAGRGGGHRLGHGNSPFSGLKPGPSSTAVSHPAGRSFRSGKPRSCPQPLTTGGRRRALARDALHEPRIRRRDDPNTGRTANSGGGASAASLGSALDPGGASAVVNDNHLELVMHAHQQILVVVISGLEQILYCDRIVSISRKSLRASG